MITSYENKHTRSQENKKKRTHLAVGDGCVAVDQPVAPLVRAAGGWDLALGARGGDALAERPHRELTRALGVANGDGRDDLVDLVGEPPVEDGPDRLHVPLRSVHLPRLLFAF